MSILGDGLSLAIRYRDVNRPGDRLVQVTLVGTIDYLSGWRLTVFWNRISMWHWSCIVFDLNRNRWNTIRSSRDRLRDVLTWHNLPTCWSFWLNINFFIGLPGKWCSTDFLT